MSFIYGVIFLSVYVVSVQLFQPRWDKECLLPELPRGISVVLGNGSKGKVYHNFNKHAHLVIAGTTGYGKTNLIKCLISQLKGEIVLIDLKGGFDYGKVTATDIQQARNELKRVAELMKQRRKDHIFVIVDEAGELLPPDHESREGKKVYLECLRYVSEIARLGRAFNVHLIYCTQYPTSDVLPRQIKQCAESRICFRLPTEVASRVALDELGAEDLPSGKYGLAIYKKDVRIEVMTYKFVERAGYDASVREKEAKGTGDFIVLG